MEELRKDNSVVNDTYKRLLAPPGGDKAASRLVNLRHLNGKANDEDNFQRMTTLFRQSRPCPLNVFRPLEARPLTQLLDFATPNAAAWPPHRGSFCDVQGARALGVPIHSLPVPSGIREMKADENGSRKARDESVGEVCGTVYLEGADRHLLHIRGLLLAVPKGDDPFSHIARLNVGGWVACAGSAVVSYDPRERKCVRRRMQFDLSPKDPNLEFSQPISLGGYHVVNQSDDDKVARPCVTVGRDYKRGEEFVALLARAGRPALSPQGDAKRPTKLARVLKVFPRRRVVEETHVYATYLPRVVGALPKGVEFLYQTPFGVFAYAHGRSRIIAPEVKRVRAVVFTPDEDPVAYTVLDTPGCRIFVQEDVCEGEFMSTETKLVAATLAVPGAPPV